MKIIMRTTGERDVSEYPPQIPALEFSIIEERDGYKNFQNAFLMAGEDSAIHLEDDIILCNNFMEKVKTIVNARPDDVIQFFSGTRADDETKGTRYENGAKFLWTQCFYLPAGMSADLLKFSHIYHGKDDKSAPFDCMVAAFLQSKKRKYLIICPSLVDHKVGKSIIDPRRNTKRVSKNFKRGQ